MSRDMTVEIDVRIEWRRFAPGQWHRVRVSNGDALCQRPIGCHVGKPGFQRRDLRSSPPAGDRCGGCEQTWPVFQWAVARLRRQRRTGA